MYRDEPKAKFEEEEELGEGQEIGVALNAGPMSPDSISHP
jgi:hypothetical protein